MTPHQIKLCAENAFEKCVLELKTDAFLTRLFDTSDIRSRMKKLGQETYAHLPHNPSDFVLTIRSRMFYAEVKGTETEAFRLNRIEKHQRAGMIRQSAANGSYYIFIFQVHEREWFRVPATFFLENKDVASIKLCNLRKEFGCGNNPFVNF